MSNAAFIHPKTGNVISPLSLCLWNALFTTRKIKGQVGEGKYEINIAFPKDADIKALQTAALEAGKEKFPKAFKDAGGKWPSGIKSPFKKTSDNDKLVAADITDAYPVMIGARSKDRPSVVGPNGKAEGVSPEDVYPGRFVKASLQAFGYETNGNRGVTFGLINVQLLDEGEELVIGGGRVSAESEFEAAEGADAGEMFS